MSTPMQAAASLRTAWLRVCLGAFLLATPVVAQDLSGTTTRGVPKLPHFGVDGPGPNGTVLQKGALPSPPHAKPRLSQGPSHAGPSTPQSFDVPLQATAPSTAGQFRFYTNEVVQPLLGFTTSAGAPSPAVGILQDSVLLTGNYYAAFSPDNGQSWSGVNPATFFTSAAGGFCCNQQVINVPSHNVVVWLLQYVPDANGNNVYRFAVADSRNHLRSGNASDWYYYDFTAQTFGYSNGYWLDFPDLAYDGTWLHCSANVQNPFNTVEAVRWRMSLADLASHAPLTFDFDTSLALGGAGYRFAKGISGGLMMWAAHKSTSELYVYSLAENSTSWNRRTNNVGSWSNATGKCPGPDGIDWCGRAVGDIRGGYGNASEAGFMWTCAQTTGRPYPYTRVARIRHDRTLIAEHDVWNSTYAMAYADANTNALGHVGGVIAVGGGNLYPHVSGFLIDQYQSWASGLPTIASAAGNSGPNQNRFGDYFVVRRHPLHPNTFFGTGSNQNGGPLPTDAEHRFLWFGRDDYEPTWINLTVNTLGVLSAIITVDVEDRNGLSSGTASFTRTFAPYQGYTLTAPAVVNQRGTIYNFDSWRYQLSPQGPYVLAPQGERTLTIDNIGLSDDVAEAIYKTRRILTVDSRNPSSGVTVNVAPPDLTASGAGITSFQRVFLDGERVTVTAPAMVGYNRFDRWIVNRVPVPNSPLTITLNMTQDHDVVADYKDNRPGSVTILGAGCLGSSGVAPVQDVTWPPGQQGPQQGTVTSYNLSAAPPNTPVFVCLGANASSWNGVPLPLSLAFINMTGCSLYHDIILQVPLATNGAGRVTLPITWPVSTATVGAHVYTTHAVVDPTANPFGLVLSNAMDTIVGGNL